jgi:hypothetical protein
MPYGYEFDIADYSNPNVITNANDTPWPLLSNEIRWDDAEEFNFRGEKSYLWTAIISGRGAVTLLCPVETYGKLHKACQEDKDPGALHKVIVWAFFFTDPDVGRLERTKKRRNIRIEWPGTDEKPSLVYTRSGSDGGPVDCFIIQFPTWSLKVCFCCNFDYCSEGK